MMFYLACGAAAIGSLVTIWLVGTLIQDIRRSQHRTFWQREEQRLRAIDEHEWRTNRDNRIDVRLLYRVEEDRADDLKAAAIWKGYNRP